MPTGIYKRKPRVPRMSDCHCDRKHFALGMCRKCYWKKHRIKHPRVIDHKKKAKSDKKYYLKHRKQTLEYVKKYYKEHRLSVLKYAAEYQKKNAKKHNESSAIFRRKNPDMYNAFGSRYRTAKTDAGGSFTAAEWKALCKKYHNRCLCCGKHKKLTADHVIPVSKGGTSNIDNIQPLCGPCNSSKKDKTTDFRREYARTQ